MEYFKTFGKCQIGEYFSFNGKIYFKTDYIYAFNVSEKKLEGILIGQTVLALDRFSEKFI